MGKRFSLNRSQRAKLAYEIKRFNATMNSLGVSDPVYFDYAKVAPYLSNKREFTQFVKRLQRLQQSSYQTITRNEAGQQIVAWEKRELQRLNRKANLQRKKSMERFLIEQDLGFSMMEDKTYYSPHAYDLSNLDDRGYIKNFLWFEFREGARNVLAVKDERYKDNYLKSLDKWPRTPQTKALKELLRKLDARTLALIALDERYNLSIQENYENLLSTAYEDPREELQGRDETLLNRWRYAIGTAEKYGVSAR